MCTPWALARALPSLVLALISSRSTSATEDLVERASRSNRVTISTSLGSSLLSSLPSSAQSESFQRFEALSYANLNEMPVLDIAKYLGNRVVRRLKRFDKHTRGNWLFILRTTITCIH